MLETNREEIKIYTNLISEIKQLNRECKSFKKNSNYKIGFIINYTFKCLKKRDVREIIRVINKFKNVIYLKKFNKKNNKKYLNCEKPNYISSSRIAIYTCIFGPYDQIIEPRICPNNCDYFIITDQNIPQDSKWKKRNIDHYKNDINNLSNVEKNRYFKMFPHLIFPEYNYSVYVDGNVEIFTDLTEYINILNDIGFITHTHSRRNCVYTEAKAIIKNKKESEQNVKKYLKKLKREEMPLEYGLLECNILVREHNKDICKQIMEQWWKEFYYFIKRDQLSLPYILYKNKIKPEKIGLLGDNVFENDSFRIVSHGHTGWKYESKN